ncbi:hypothetical protein CSB45_05800 [candidate division KSB3 bacterium]|uniref:Uncharacterized protein n=1 Tax=candidate division KSB3 bacterium TaxID=2044937 RepID=A0A2G6E6N6_9BACT|nr:MAG: hypothetical protein CSB45_05800 [candidate division KSB3 bacterium]PIE30164.1 MAG: hypothetical protein CSA57_04510 [candidate division KSB3 bacterium]
MLCHSILIKNEPVPHIQQKVKRVQGVSYAHDGRYAMLSCENAFTGMSGIHLSQRGVAARAGTVSTPLKCPDNSS